MTYADRSLVKEVVIKVRLSERDEARLQALQSKTGEQKAALARNLLLTQLEIALQADKQQGDK